MTLDAMRGPDRSQTFVQPPKIVCQSARSLPPRAMATTAPGAHSRLITVGDYAGMLGRDALAEISAARLIATIEPTPVDEIEQAGFVVGQEPPAGEQRRRGQMVVLYIADHPDAVLAPPPEEPASAPKRRRSRPQEPALFD